MTLKFERGAERRVIECFDKTVDSEGYIIDEETRKREEYRGKEVHIDDLGVIEDGSTRFVDDSFASLVDFVERNRESSQD